MSIYTSCSGIHLAKLSDYGLGNPWNMTASCLKFGGTYHLIMHALNVLIVIGA